MLCVILHYMNFLFYTSVTWHVRMGDSQDTFRALDMSIHGQPKDQSHRQATALGKLLTPMCLCHQAVQFGTGQRAVMLCDQEGNRHTGHASQTSGLSTYELNSHREGDEHPTYTRYWGMVHFTFTKYWRRRQDIHVTAGYGPWKQTFGRSIMD